MGEKKIIWVGTIREATSTELNRFDSHCTKYVYAPLPVLWQ